MKLNDWRQVDHIEIRAQRSFANRGVQLFVGGTIVGRITEQGPVREVFDVSSIEVQPVARDIVAPVFATLRDQEAQALLDDLYTAGFRPSRTVADVPGVTDQYIGDLRKWCDRMLETLLQRRIELNG